MSDEASSSGSATKWSVAAMERLRELLRAEGEGALSDDDRIELSVLLAARDAEVAARRKAAADLRADAARVRAVQAELTAAADEIDRRNAAQRRSLEELRARIDRMKQDAAEVPDWDKRRRDGDEG